MAYGQNSQLEGHISRQLSDEKHERLVGAQVYWQGTSTGVFTDTSGFFRINRRPNQENLIIRFVGMTPDTLEVRDSSYINITLTEGKMLNEVVVSYSRKTSEVSILNTRFVQEMNEGELLKAACCNLSESFVTNPSVDVSITDAVSGTKQIKMLGLAGPNVLYSEENIPSIRGFSSLYGLKFIPGSWIHSIQISKGTGSVVNGFEGISGQMNVELKKADEGDRLHLNAYINRQGRTELNAITRHNLSQNISTAVLAHGSMRQRRLDVNEDGFLDMPIEQDYSFINRWRYTDQRGWRARLVLQSARLDHVAGQKSYERDMKDPNIWGMQSIVNRHAVWAKLGRAFEDTPWRSFGSQYKAEYYQQQSKFGSRVYDNLQRSLYANFIYQSIIANINHVIKIGSSISQDDYEESFESLDLNRLERTVGLFTEYTFEPNESFSLIAGLRFDYHNLFDFFATPRIHIRYAPWDEAAFRISAGKAYRTANVINDNVGLLATNRKVIIEGNNSESPYGLPQTESWNYGASFVQNFQLQGSHEGQFTLEFYHTRFSQSVIVDRDYDPQAIYFYAQQGENFSNSLQAQVDYELLEGFDLRLAYRWFDVQRDYKLGRLSAPLIAEHRFFMNVGYDWKSKWVFDYTFNLMGEQRLPQTQSNPEKYQMDAYSPVFATHSMQVTHHFTPRFNIYLGFENLFGFRQEEIIISPENPFSEYFDASMVWGPLNETMVYLGFRYSIKE